MKTYGQLRRALRDPEAVAKGINRIFVRLATRQGGVIAAMVAMAAMDAPQEHAARLLGRDVTELDALTVLFSTEVGRSVAAERHRLDEEAAA